MAQTYKLRSATKLSIGSRCIMLMEIFTLLSFLEEKACLKQGRTDTFKKRIAQVKVYTWIIYETANLVSMQPLKNSIQSRKGETSKKAEAGQPFDQETASKAAQK